MIANVILRRPVAPPAQGGAVQISGVSGTLTHGSTLTINGSGFGTRADFGGSEAFLCRGWNPFTSALEAGGFLDDPEGQNPVAANLALATSSPLGGACTQFFRKQNINRSLDEQLGTVTVITSGNPSCFYSSYWHRQAAGMPAGGAAGSKSYRQYYNDAFDSVHYGPGLEAATNIVTPPAEINRWSGVSTFGGSSAFLALIDNVWVFYEWTLFLAGGTTAFGSSDYMECYCTIPGVGRARLMRRGTGLASNPVPLEGTDANENQQWLASSATQNGHTGPDLGSLLAFGEAPGAYYDYHDAYHDHTIARVMLGNASTLAACDRLHMQPPLAWSSTQIQVQLNRGAFVSLSGKYLYVVDSDNVVNANGFVIP